MGTSFFYFLLFVTPWQVLSVCPKSSEAANLDSIAALLWKSVDLKKQKMKFL